MPDEPRETAAPSNDTSTSITTDTDGVGTDNSNNSAAPSVLIGLQIKSLEQRTHSVTLPRNASVLELKNEIQATLDVDSGRQRLIFQGKVLKDDKNLMDYANLDDGKVIHLVIRPLDAPQNPMNDEPRPTGRRIFGNRGRPFPSIASRLPMMEGYTFITLDAHIGDTGDNNSFFSSLMNGLTGANPFHATNTPQNQRSIRTSSTAANNTSSTNGRQPQQTSSTSNLFPSFLTRSPFELRRSLETASNTSAIPNHNRSTTATTNTNATSDSANTTTATAAATTTTNNNSNNNGSSTNNTSSDSRPSLRLPFPSSVEMRLSRTVAYIRNVTNIVAAPLDQGMSAIPYTSASSPDFIQEIRSSLRGNGNSQSYQVGTVMNELADLMERATPWLRDVASMLQDEGSQSSNQDVLLARVLRAARVIQGMSLINHFMGSVLASADMDGRRTRGQESTTSSAFGSPVIESWLAGDASRNNTSNTSNTPLSQSTTATTSTPRTSAPPTASSSSPSSSSSSSSTVQTEKEPASQTTDVDQKGTKRKRDDDQQETTDDSNKRGPSKGKEKESKKDNEG